MHRQVSKRESRCQDSNFFDKHSNGNKKSTNQFPLLGFHSERVKVQLNQKEKNSYKTEQ